MTKLLSPQLRTELKALYRQSHVLWAVVSGHDTLPALIEHFSCQPPTTARHLGIALDQNLVYYRGNRLMPTDPQHKQLKDLVKRARERKARRKLRG